MPQINTPGSGHGNKTVVDSDFFEYTDKSALYTLKRAIFILDNNVKGMRPCNTCFKKLPGGRTFDEVWADKSIWISYDSRDVDWYGATDKVGGTEISITKKAFQIGRWWVAGTLVHELAHTNGAPATTAQADEVLLCCGLKNAYEGAIGMYQSNTKGIFA